MLGTHFEKERTKKRSLKLIVWMAQVIDERPVIITSDSMSPQTGEGEDWTPFLQSITKPGQNASESLLHQL